jgi:hypothetical protein
MIAPMSPRTSSLEAAIADLAKDPQCLVEVRLCFHKMTKRVLHLAHLLQDDADSTAVADVAMKG